MIVLAAGLPRCRTDQHATSEPQAGKIAICTACYDQIQKVRTWQGRSGPIRDEVRVTHHCESCKSEMTVSSEGGTLKIRCPACAPAGVDCDLCAPKGGSRRPS